MFNQLSAKAAGITSAAKTLATDGGQREVRPVHLFLAILEDEGPTGAILNGLGLDVERVRMAAASSGPADADGSRRRFGFGARKVQFSASSRRSLELSLEEAGRLNGKEIGAGAILLGVLRAGDDELSDLLNVMSVRPASLRTRVEELMRAGEL